jgi:microcystin-dependent protein
MKISLYDELTTPVGDDVLYIYDVSENKHKKIKKSNLIDKIIFLPGDLKYSTKGIADTGWLICDGSEVSRDEYADLFDVIGETFGAGDSVDTFNLPNFMGNLVIPESGSEPFEAQGNNGGDQTHTVIEDEMAEHDHETEAIMYTPSPVPMFYTPGPTQLQYWIPVASPQNTSSTGGDDPHNNLMPFTTIGSIQIKI